MTQLAEQSTSETQASRGTPVWLVILVIASVAIGIGFRFYHLDFKIYWHDETWTSVHVGGHRLEDVIRVGFAGKKGSFADLMNFQRVDPQSHFTDTIRALSLDDPKHPPLYYALARMWAVWVGDSVGSLRALSAILSVLALPCAYWFARELFANSTVSSRIVAAWALALFAVSPFQVLYAQEAREYSLWTITILLASATLLRARRVGSFGSWALYTFTLVAAWHSHTLTALLVLIHAAYLLIVRAPRRQWLAFAGAVVVSLLLFVPWAITIIKAKEQLQNNTNWINDDPYTKWELMRRFFRGIATSFVDLHPVLWTPDLFDVLPIAWPVSILVVIAVAFTCRRAGRSAGAFVLCSMLIPTLAMLVPDLIFGGRRSTPLRYHLPMYVALQMAVAYAIAALASNDSTPGASRLRRWCGVFLGVLLLMGGVISCWMSADEIYWWNKGRQDWLLASMDVLRSAEHPLLISNPSRTNLGDLMTMAHLEPDLETFLVPGGKWPLPKEVNGFKRDEVFIFISPDRFDMIKQMYRDRVEEIPDTMLLRWRKPTTKPTTRSNH